MPQTHQAEQATLFAVSTQQEDDGWRLRLAGEFDIAGTDAALSAFEELLLRPGAAVVVDLSELTFIDSTGLRFLIAAQQRCAEHERTLAITRGGPAVQRLFELTRMDAVLPFTR